MSIDLAHPFDLLQRKSKPHSFKLFIKVENLLLLITKLSPAKMALRLQLGEAFFLLSNKEALTTARTSDFSNKSCLKRLIHPEHSAETPQLKTAESSAELN